MKHYTVCLSLDRKFCETATKEVAERHNAIDYEIVVMEQRRGYPVAYRGEIILQEDE
jgi:hypothetical protein